MNDLELIARAAMRLAEDHGDELVAARPGRGLTYVRFQVLPAGGRTERVEWEIDPGLGSRQAGAYDLGDEVSP